MEVSTYFNFLAALAIVLCLIGILAWIAKWLGLGGRLTATARSGNRRLGLEELKPLDSHRKLVLLRCDDREHLVLLN